MGKIVLIALMLVLAVVMLLLELLVLPGITVAGIAGVLLLAGAVVLSYTTYGLIAGHIVLGISLLLAVILTVYALRARTWKRISLQTELTGKVNLIDKAHLHPGDSGRTITRLNPMGKVMVNGQVLEARSEDGLVDQEQEIVVVRVLESGIVVKLKSE